MSGRNYRIRFTGPVPQGIVAWMGLLIDVLRRAPDCVDVDITITRREEPDEPAPQGTAR